MDFPESDNNEIANEADDTTDAAPTDTGVAPVVAPEANVVDEPAASTDDEGPDELAILDGLESDMLAVENAIAALDQLADAGASGMTGQELEAAVTAAVPHERFGSTES